MYNLFPFSNNFIFLVNREAVRKDLFFFLNKYPNQSFKKKIMFLYLWLIIFLKLYIFFKKSDNQLTDDLKKYFKKNISSILIFSQNIKFRQRFYSFSVGINGRLSFHKYVWGKEVNRLKNEFFAKDILSNKSNSSFEFIFPRNIDVVNEIHIINYDFVPTKSTLLRKKPIDIYKFFLNINRNNKFIKKRKYDYIINTSWWLKFNSIKTINQFKTHLKQVISKNNLFELVYSHGDLGSENVFLNKKGYVVIDWEKFSTDAPRITDLLGIVLGNNSKKIISQKNKIKNKKSLLQFYKSHITSDFTYSDFLIGLVFYLGTDFNLAHYLINNFVNDVD